MRCVIALSRYLAELHKVHESTFLIFDEIFGSQDEERRNNLLTALRTRGEPLPCSLLLISHIGEMQGKFSNTLMIAMSTNTTGRANEVEYPTGSISTRRLSMPTCPVCASDMVYPLLNTLRCKRCKHIWKAGEETPDTCGCPDLVPSMRIRKKTDPLEKRLARRLDALLARHNGKFCLTTMTWQAGDIPLELFRRYLKRCVKDRALEETPDRYGRTWYKRPE